MLIIATLLALLSNNEPEDDTEIGIPMGLALLGVIIGLTLHHAAIVHPGVNLTLLYFICIVSCIFAGVLPVIENKQAPNIVFELWSSEPLDIVRYLMYCSVFVGASAFIFDQGLFGLFCGTVCGTTYLTARYVVQK